ncbi:glycosyltransferase family 4 protein [Candidatus Uhrbacteria bacterium]|nr:glycosyltransferase family 4 protein [Candidatus Uhrbacteria bacterium]
MRILVDIRHLNQQQQSGVGEYTRQLLRALFEIDKKNKYVLLSSGRICSRDPSVALLLKDDRAECIHLSTPNKLLNLRTLLLKHPTINWRVRDPIDLIFLPNLNITSLPTDIPTVLTIHDLSWNFFPEFYSKKMRLWHKATRPNELISSAAHILTPSTSTKLDVMSVFQKPEEKISVVPHGIDPTFSPKMEARDHGVRSRLKLPKNFALFVGTLEPRKNILGLIEGIKQYRNKYNDDLSLVLVGKWGWKSTQLRHRLWKKDVSAWAHHLGYVPSEDRSALYRSASVLTWPSIYEGFGLPVLEAMASGAPVITSNTSSLPELTQDSAILVDPYNPNDIAEALRGILNSKPLQQRQKERGILRAADFSWKKTAKETLEIFESLY